MTYRELDEQSDTVAANLVKAGVGADDAVGVHLPNIGEFLVAYFGILKAGGVMVPMNVLLKGPEIAFYLRDSTARTCITWAPFAAEARAGAVEAGIDRLYVVAAPGLPAPEAGRAPTHAGTGPVLTSWSDLLDTSAIVTGRRVFAPRQPDDTAVLLYTSGTTGRPKGAELSHIQLYMNADIPGRLFKMSADDVAITVLPLFHVFGLSSILNTVVRFNATMVLIPRFDAGAVLDAIAETQATVFMGVPTMFIGLLHHPNVEKYDVSSLRIAISGGAPIPAEVIDAFEATFGIYILEGYGLSETASTATFNRSFEERRVYSVGKPTWGVEVEVWDDDGITVPRGKDHIGELVIRGYNVMKGYFGMPEATAEAFAGGWFHTGDLGYQDEDGFLFIVDRKKELIIRGGYNVYPREVEEVLYAHPAVAEVAVIGVPDDRLGEEVKAFVVLKPGQVATSEALIDYTKEQLAAYKYPRSIEFLDSLPKGPTGKILKRELPLSQPGVTDTPRQ